MAQQTAVDLFMAYVSRHKEFLGYDLDEVYKQAKQMEKEQIVKAWDDGDYAYFYSKETGRDFDNGEEYYNENYNKQ
jgi:hypothetical protein